MQEGYVCGGGGEPSRTGHAGMMCLVLGASNDKSCRKHVFSGWAAKDMSCGKDVFSVWAFEDAGRRCPGPARARRTFHVDENVVFTENKKT